MASEADLEDTVTFRKSVLKRYWNDFFYWCVLLPKLEPIFRRSMVTFIYRL